MFNISINDDLNIIDILRFIQYNNENVHDQLHILIHTIELLTFNGSY